MSRRKWRLAEGHAMSDTARCRVLQVTGNRARRRSSIQRRRTSCWPAPRRGGVELLGPDGLLSQVTRAVVLTHVDPVDAVVAGTVEVLRPGQIGILAGRREAMLPGVESAPRLPARGPVQARAGSEPFSTEPAGRRGWTLRLTSRWCRRDRGSLASRRRRGCSCPSRAGPGEPGFDTRR